MQWFRGLLGIAATLAVVACGDDDDNGPAEPATSFTADLRGSEEVPPVLTGATGTATLTLNGAAIDYTVEVNGLQNVAFAHIHINPVGVNGPVRLNLCGTPDTPACATTGDGVLITGSNGTTFGTPPITFDSLLSAMRTGGAYVNVHTNDGTPPDNTGAGDMINGEIRGQVVAE